MDEDVASRRAPLAAAIAALVAVVIGLLALLDVGPFADEELTAEQFVAQGDEVCRQAHAEFRSIQETPPRTPSDAAEQAQALVAVAEEERDAISDLNEPGDLRGAVEAYLAAREEGIDLLRSGLEAAEDGDAEEYERFQAEVARSQLPRLRRAREIGFEICSRPLVSREELGRQGRRPAPSDPEAPPQVDNPPT